MKKIVVIVVAAAVVVVVVVVVAAAAADEKNSGVKKNFCQSISEILSNIFTTLASLLNVSSDEA